MKIKDLMEQCKYMDPEKEIGVLDEQGYFTPFVTFVGILVSPNSLDFQQKSLYSFKVTDSFNKHVLVIRGY